MKSLDLLVVIDKIFPIKYVVNLLEFFGYSFKNNNVYCYNCDLFFLFDKEKIKRTTILKSKKKVFTLVCPKCFGSCFKSEDNLNEKK